MFVGVDDSVGSGVAPKLRLCVGVIVLVGVIEGVTVFVGVGVGSIHNIKQNPPCGDTRPGPPDILTGVF